jgi:radical SAM protein with 4Fe4S-binding SPASM domain
MYDVCEYCYVKEQKRNFPLDMAPQDFNNIIIWFKAIGVDEIIFLGGEPILHPKFSEFLKVIKNNTISARLFTNGTYNSATANLISANKYVETLFFHYDENYLKRSAQSKESFFRNLKQASESNKRIWLRWNIDKPDIDSSELITLARQYSANIGYSISVPTPCSNMIPVSEVHKYSDNLMHLVELASTNGIRLEPARAIPLCAFSEQQLKFLKKQGNLQGNCIAINDITINTDLSLQLCSVTHPISASRVTGVEDLKRKIEFLKKEEVKLRSVPVISECNKCKLFKDKECQGGCYAYKLYGDKQKKSQSENVSIK